MPDWAADQKIAHALVYTNVTEWVRLTGRAPDYTSGTFSLATSGVYCPVEVPVAMIIEAFYVANGASVNGNHHMGIARASEEGGFEPSTIGALFSEIAAQAGTSQWQALTPTEERLIGPGRYYLMYSSSSATGTVQRLYASTTNNCGENRMGRIHTGAPFPLWSGGSVALGTVTGGSVVPVLAVAGRAA